MTKLERSRLRIGGLIAIGVALIAVVLPLFFDLGSFASSTAPAAAPPQSMELRGNWLGMSLAAANSPAAWQLGVPRGMDGIAVVEVSPGPDPRAIQAGLAPGDVIQAVNAKGVDSLSELFTVTTRLDGAQPVQLQIRRQGMPMNLTVPPAGFANPNLPAQAYGPMPGPATPAAAQYFPQAVPAAAWNAGTPAPAYGPGTGMHRYAPQAGVAAGFAPQAAAPQAACPNTFAQ